MTKKAMVENIRNKSGFICDMDGVIYHGNKILDGVKEFVGWLKEENKKFVFLTNSSERTIKELQGKLSRMGLDVGPEHFYTSALATATFLQNQKPNGSAYIIGEAGLINALYNAGYSSNNIDPDYVVMGEARSYSYEVIEKAVNLVNKGAKLVGTNPDLTGPIENGIAPATKALISPIELATGKQAYFVGKPNPLMMRIALKKLGIQREDTIIIGDRMDTDIVAGIEAEIDTCLVLSGISTTETIKEFAYRPHYVLKGVNEIVKDYSQGK
ncbi:HAD-IIA family hydrolase [Saccharicrinis sp. FJH54]|uniref:HAD-IIA family hydrolase n=1 Tax=Saccharicrinis sp. FJH54 TaxID=3344665 RepID=UPI0035D3F0F4